MSTTRLQHWPELMADEIAKARSREFEWGEHDCCVFAARVVLAMTGHNFLTDYPEYRSEAAAAIILEEFDGVLGIANKCLGTPVTLNFAQRGDVVLLPQAAPVVGGDALGICVNSRAAFASIKGLTLHPMAMCSVAWRV